MATIEVMKGYFKWWIDSIKEDNVSLITRQPILKDKKTNNKPWKARKIVI